MTKKEFNLRIMAFLVIGTLLLLSFGICIYIVNSERDLVPISADVIDVKKDSDGTGKNDVTVSYKVNNTFYEYNFYYKDDVNVDDKIQIYYHSGNITSVKSNKTTKLIFLFPLVGLIFCLVGLYELFRKTNKDEEDEFKTKVISVIGDTEQLEIITDEQVESYVKSPEEEAEVSVKSIINKEEVVPEETSTVDNFIDIQDDTSITIDSFALKEEVKEEVKKEKTKVKKEKVKKVHTPKEVIKLIPKYYYVTGSTLVYDLVGKEGEELNLNKVIDYVKTINSEGKIVKVNVVTKDVSLLLTNMSNVDLEKVANTIHNKLVAIDYNFKEKIEYKEW